MAKRLNPYVIKRADGSFYTRSHIVSTRDDVEKATKTVVTTQVCKPVFSTTDETQATQFHTKEDAEKHIANPDLGGPDAFAGCTVVPTFE